MTFIDKTVTRVSTKTKTVIMDNNETLAYDVLILAPGGAPRKLPIPRSDLKNVFTLRHAGNTKEIDEGGYLYEK